MNAVVPLPWGPCVDARAFFLRATKLPHSYLVSYDRLIRQLIQAGIWQKLDALYVFATANSASALLNLRSSSFPCVANGSPTFTTDRGYTGVDASTTVYLDTGFNPASGSNKFVQDSAHLSAWIATDAGASGAAGGVVIGNFDNATLEADILPNYNDGLAYFRANDAGGSAGITPSSHTGSFISTRTASGAQQGYINGVSAGVTSTTSGAVANASIHILGRSDVGAGSNGSADQIAAASIGGGLTASDAQQLHVALRQFMTARGVP